MEPVIFALVALRARAPAERGKLIDDLARRLAEIAGADGCLVHDVIDDRQLGIHHARGAMRLDAFIEITPDSRSNRAAIERLRRRRSELEPAATYASFNFVSCLKNVVLPVANNAEALTKRMSLITRLPGLSEARFVEEWTGRHAREVPALPRIAGYSQDIVAKRYDHLMHEADEKEVPVDGIVELWFPDADAIVAAFTSPQAEITQGHARTFLETITTFLVETRTVPAA